MRNDHVVEALEVSWCVGCCTSTPFRNAWWHKRASGFLAVVCRRAGRASYAGPILRLAETSYCPIQPEQRGAASGREHAAAPIRRGGLDARKSSEPSHRSVVLRLLCPILRAARDPVSYTTLQVVSIGESLCERPMQHTKSIAPRTSLYFTPGQSCARPPLTNTTECCCTL